MTGTDPITALQAALAAEHAAIYGYGVVGAHLPARRRDAAHAERDAHRAGRDALRAMVRARGATPVAAAPAYAVPFEVADERAAVRLAVALEEATAAAYLGLVAVVDPKVRALAATAVAEAAVRGARWRGQAVAFPGLPPSALTPRSSAAPPA